MSHFPIPAFSQLLLAGEKINDLVRSLLQPEIHYLAGELHRRTGSPAEASAAYQKALDGDGSPALKDLTRRQKALVEK